MTTDPDHDLGPDDTGSSGPAGRHEDQGYREVARSRGGFGVLAAGGIALGMHLVVGAAYALTLLLAPLWVNLLLALWWLVLLLAGLLLLARRSLWVLAVPLLAIGSWAALVAAGRAWFGWH
jgi:hypothetical protein